jgi:hypothetical protein
MNFMQTLFLFAGLLLPLHTFSPSALAENTTWAEVKFLKGKASAGVEALKVGSKIALGDVITTGKQSFVRILIPGEGAAMQVGPESTVRLTKRDPAITRIDLVKGFILSSVRPQKKASAKSRFQVHNKMWLWECVAPLFS